MKKIIVLIILILIYGKSIALTYQTVEEKPLPHALGFFKHLQFNINTNAIDIYCVKLSPDYQARLYQQPETNQILANYINQLNQTFTIAINGGFYTPEYQPVGLLMDHNKKINSWAKSSLLSGCVRMNAKGKLSIGENKSECIKAWSALQAGPVILSQGNSMQFHSFVNQSPRLQDFFNENYRTIVAMSTQQEIIILVTSPVKLNDIAGILQHFPKAFMVNKIKTAINLDGGSSTGLYIQFATPFYFHEKKPVKTFIFFNPS